VLRLVPCVCMLSPLPRQVRETKSLVTNPSTSAFPKFRVGRLLHYGFRGLFSVHSHYGLQTRQVALCDPLHRRLRRLCCLHRRSNCYRVERSSSRAGLSFPLWTSAFSRRTEKSRLTRLRFAFKQWVAGRQRLGRHRASLGSPQRGSGARASTVSK